MARMPAFRSESPISANTCSAFCFLFPGMAQAPSTVRPARPHPWHAEYRGLCVLILLSG
jgi:hypothetical protein